MTAPTVRPLAGEESPPPLDLDWPQVRERLDGAEDYYVASVSAAGAPHVVPVLGVWLDDHLHINTDPRARKARQLRANPAVAVLVAGPDYDFTIEGTATLVRDETLLRRVAAGFPVKYDWWHPWVEDGRFYANETDVPRDILAISPRAIFGFGKASGFCGSRFDFAAA